MLGVCLCGNGVKERRMVEGKIQNKIMKSKWDAGQQGEKEVKVKGAEVDMVGSRVAILSSSLRE